MDIISPEAWQYALQHSSEADPLLQEIEQYTQQHHREAHMLSGPLQGQFLSLFSRLLRPAAVLEIGTYTGYSAICLAKGLRSDGQLHTIELREAEASVARQFFDRSSYAHQLHLHQGDARSVLPGLTFSWDLVFLDADKVSYTDYFNMILPRVRPGGFILADNVFFHGQVFAPALHGKSAKAIAAFNEYIKGHPDVEVLLLPIRDGISVIQKRMDGNK
ncbi:MAG: O-methyltransferase [Sphingomonadales bacterium]